tara:strand:- start:2751 stop:5420 length:2670 start_codon:yes stop_codon:yes gene_type:complete
MTKIAGKKTNDGKRGGNLKGKPHDDIQGRPAGGIKAVVTDNNNQPVELEGGEVIINKAASKKHWKELSRINQSAGNGVAIGPPVDPHESDPEEYKSGGKIDFNPNKVPNKWILKYAENIKANHKDVWDLGGNIFGNEAFTNLKRVSDRGYWLDSEKWMMIKWRSYVARHKKDFRIAGVIAMLKWVDKVDKGWPYMKQLIEAEIKKRSNKKQLGGKTSKKDEIECYSCSWSWDKADGGDDMYVCHNCGEDNEHKYKKGGKTHKENYNTKYNHPKGESHSLKDISKETGVGMKGIQQIYNKGVGAFKTNPSSVRDNVKSKEQWAQARVYSSVTGGKAAKVDAKELKMETGGNITVNGDEYEVGSLGRWNGNKVLEIQINKITGSSVFFWDKTNGKEIRKKKVDFNKLYVPDGKMLPTSAQKKASPRAPKTTTSAPVKKGPGKSWDSILKYYQDEYADEILWCVRNGSRNKAFVDGEDYKISFTRHTTKSFGVFFTDNKGTETGYRLSNAQFLKKIEKFVEDNTWEMSFRGGKVLLAGNSVKAAVGPSNQAAIDRAIAKFKTLNTNTFYECTEATYNVAGNQSFFVRNDYIIKNDSVIQNRIFNQNIDFKIYTKDSDTLSGEATIEFASFKYQIKRLEDGRNLVITLEDETRIVLKPIDVAVSLNVDEIKSVTDKLRRALLNKIWESSEGMNGVSIKAKDQFTVSDMQVDINGLSLTLKETTNNTKFNFEVNFSEAKNILLDLQEKVPRFYINATEFYEAKKAPRKKFPEPKQEPFNKGNDYLMFFKKFLGDDAKEISITEVATKTNLAYLEIAKSPTKKADTLQLRFKSKSEYLEFLKLVDESEILNIVKDLKHSKRTKDWGVEMRIDELKDEYGNYIDGLKGDFPSIIIS